MKEEELVETIFAHLQKVDLEKDDLQKIWLVRGKILAKKSILTES